LPVIGISLSNPGTTMIMPGIPVVSAIKHTLPYNILEKNNSNAPSHPLGGWASKMWWVGGGGGDGRSQPEVLGFSRLNPPPLPQLPPPSPHPSPPNQLKQGHKICISSL